MGAPNVHTFNVINVPSAVSGSEIHAWPSMPKIARN